jgi:hypothetical protein
VGREKTQRIARNAIIVVVLLASAIAIVSYAVHPQNVALHKLAVSDGALFDTKPAGAVNGRIYEKFGFHSEARDSPWLIVDLGRVYAIDGVRVYGRHDCCFDESVPMAVELSSDAATFNELAMRTEPFDQIDPWYIRPEQPAKARFVRVRSLKKTFLVLAELEVYGKPAAP